MAEPFYDLRLPAKQAWQDLEEKLQRECAEWLKKQLYLRGEKQLFYHVPNEGQHKIQYRAKQRALGVLPGVSDVVLPLRSEHYVGIYCELKKAGNAPSPEQLEFLAGVAAEDHLAVVINDLETFKRVFSYYLDQRKCKPSNIQSSASLNSPPASSSGPTTATSSTAAPRSHSSKRPKKS